MSRNLRMSEEALAAYRKRITLPTKATVVAPELRACGLTLPWPPTGNHNVKHANGAHYMTAKHKAFRVEVAARVLEAGLHRQPMKGRLRVTMYACFPDKRKRDIDNLIKPVLDSLMHAGVYADDSAIDELQIFRSDAAFRTKGEIDVLVETL